MGVDGTGRVLVLLASANRRGAEIEGERLARELRAIGLDVQVAALSPGTAPALDVTVLGDRPLSLRVLAALRRSAASVDVVVAYGSSTLPACAIGLFGTRTPFVYRSIGDPRNWVRAGLHRRRTGWMMRRAARVVALWPDARDSIADLYSVSPQAIDVIPNARSRDEFVPASPAQRAAARAELGLATSSMVVSFIGSLSSEKRPGLAVDVVANIPGASLLVVGDGPLRRVLEAQVRDMSDGRIRLLGAVPLLTDVYAATDVVLSTSSTEGMSGVLIEAGMCGIPVCATDVGATRWLFDRGLGGTLVDVDAGAPAIAAALKRAASAPGLVPPLACCDWQGVTEQWTAVLTRVPP